ncbi:hypothetical protein B0H13DRAFT_2172313 [Mycena leptocephala]|nr:hypothetical protein B0H13DRAFT_2172313 [Mycena leptocephala]
MRTALTPVLHVPAIGLHPHVYHQPIRPPRSTRNSVASHVACFILYASPRPPSTPTSHLPNYRECGRAAFPLTAAAAPVLLVPRMAAPIPHRPCTDAQHPAMCSAPGMRLSGPVAAASAPVAHDRFVDVSPYGTSSPHCIPSPPHVAISTSVDHRRCSVNARGKKLALLFLTACGTWLRPSRAYPRLRIFHLVR